MPKLKWESIYYLNPVLKRAGVSLEVFLRNPLESIENVMFSRSFKVSDIRMSELDFHPTYEPLLPPQKQVQTALDYSSSILSQIGERGE
jgi:hypothetical protein